MHGPNGKRWQIAKDKASDRAAAAFGRSSPNVPVPCADWRLGRSRIVTAAYAAPRRI